MVLFDSNLTARRGLVDWATPLLSQLLYLCSEEPEIEDSSGKKHLRLFLKLKRPRREIGFSRQTESPSGNAVAEPERS